MTKKIPSGDLTRLEELERAALEARHHIDRVLALVEQCRRSQGISAREAAVTPAANVSGSLRIEGNVRILRS